jgi:hypothetical protein
MPRPILHLPKHRGPRENDIGHLIHEARAVGLFVRELGEQRVELLSTKAQNVLFSGAVPDASAWLRDRR